MICNLGVRIAKTHAMFPKTQFLCSVGIPSAQCKSLLKFLLLTADL